MPDFDSTYIVIDRKDIESMNFQVIRDYMDNFDYNETLIYENKSRLDISIQGYDTDERELFEIIEVINWFRLSVYGEQIPWFLLLSTSPNSQGLKILTLCCIAEPVKSDNELWYFVPNKEKLQEFALVNFGIMNKFFEDKKLLDSQNTEISNGINDFFHAWLSKE